MAELPPFYLDEMKALNLDEQAERLLSGYARRHLRQMPMLAEDAFADEGHGFKINQLHPLGRLAVLIWKLAEVRGKYLAYGIPEAIICDTFGDVSLRQRLFYELGGKVGLSRMDCNWLRHLVNAEIFKLGVLQYQPIGMFYLESRLGGRPSFTISAAQKALLPVGTPVLNVHIQARADLTPERVTESFSMAKDFFAHYFPETPIRAMVCYSWLLHSGLSEILPESSRIVQFAKNFKIVSETADNKQAKERIFGGHYRRMSDYPQRTSLRRAALRDMSKLGYAFGVIYLD